MQAQRLGQQLVQGDDGEEGTAAMLQPEANGSGGGGLAQSSTLDASSSRRSSATFSGSG